MIRSTIHGIRTKEQDLLDQIIDPEKTEYGLYVKTFMCSESPEKIHNDFERIRSFGTGRNKILSQHIVLEGDRELYMPEHIFQAGCAVCRQLLKNEYQYVVSVIVEDETVRCHILFNNINIVNGKTFETLQNQGRNRAWEKLRDICNEISEIFLPPDVFTVQEDDLPFLFNKKKKLSNRFMLKWCINYSVKHNYTWESFIDTLKKYNVDVLFDPDKPCDLRFRLGENENPVSAKKLGWAYETQQLRQQMWLIHKYPNNNAISDNRSYFEHMFFDRYGINRWNEIRSSDKSDKLVNMIFKLGVNSIEQLESQILLKHISLWNALIRLNSIQNSIYRINDNLTWMYAARKYMSYYDALEDNTGCDTNEKNRAILDNYNKVINKLKMAGTECTSETDIKKCEEDQENMINEWRSQKKKNNEMKERIKELEMSLSELDTLLNMSNPS